MSESDINVFAIAPVDADAWLDRLPAHERHSALTIRDLTARARLVSGRVGLRALLSERTGCRAADIGLEIATTGAVSSPAKDWVFSISHADALSVIALARRSPVGVDIEVLRQVDDALLIASHHMHAAEQEWLREFPYPTLSFCFLRLWVRKEAVVKASGQGLSSRLHTWHALPPARGLAEFTIRDANGRSWQLHDLEMDENHVLCVATAPGAAVGSPVMLSPGWLARLWY